MQLKSHSHSSIMLCLCYQGDLKLSVECLRNLPKVDEQGWCDAYVVIHIAGNDSGSDLEQRSGHVLGGQYETTVDENYVFGGLSTACTINFSLYSWSIQVGSFVITLV